MLHIRASNDRSLEPAAMALLRLAPRLNKAAIRERHTSGGCDTCDPPRTCTYVCMYVCMHACMYACHQSVVSSIVSGMTTWEREATSERETCCLLRRLIGSRGDDSRDPCDSSRARDCERAHTMGETSMYLVSPPPSPHVCMSRLVRVCVCVCVCASSAPVAKPSII